MARYNTGVKDWVVRYKHGRFKFGVRTLQQGVTQFSRKKKNACKLFSTRKIKESVNKTVEREGVLTYAVAFPKINLKNPEATPKVVIKVRRTVQPGESKYGRDLGRPSVG